MSIADIMSVKFRASSVGNLLVGGNAITDKQLARLDELWARKNDAGAKPLTANMQSELDELIAKRDGEFKFGATAMSYIRECWLRNVYGYDEPIITSEMLKGILCEDDAIGVLTRQVQGGFRVKNDEQFEDAWFTGEPDVLLGSDWVEDVKCSWTLRTFVETQRADPLYYSQGQTYLSLTGRRYFRLAHVLVETPFEIVEEERKRYFFKFNCDEDNPHYKKAIAQVDAMHLATRKIPESQRIKVFEFQRHDGHIETLRQRVELARRVYESMTLGGEA